MRRLIRTGFAVSVLSSFIPIEALAQGANTGVGGDPRNSVAQPEMSGNPSAIATTSIQASLGAASDPNGLRRFLSDHGIVYSFSMPSPTSWAIRAAARAGPPPSSAASACSSTPISDASPAGAPPLSGWKPTKMAWD